MCVNNNCGCNNPKNPVVCYNTDPTQPCIGVNLTVNNTETIDGSSGTNMILEETNNITAFKDHLEFVNSPEPLSGLKRNVVLRLTDKFISVISNLFRGRNIGSGAEIYKGALVDGLDTFQEFRKLQDSDSINFTQNTNDITAVVNEDWLQNQFPEIPTVNYPVIESEDVGTGTSMRRDLSGKKIGVRTLKSDNIIITEEEDGSIKINNPGGGSSSDDYFLDVNFSRPSNWEDNAESIDGIKTAQGTLNDPFKTFEEYLRRCIGETGGSNVFGLYSRINPKNPNKKLRVLSDLTTDKVLEINNSKIYLENNITLIYNGSESRVVDTERLWNAMPKTAGVLNRSIMYEIGGEGTLINLNNFGVINHKTSIASTSDTVGSTFFISPTLSGLKIKESTESATYTLLTNADGSPYLEAGVQVKGSTQAPITPLITVDGENKLGFALNIRGTSLQITSNTQSFVQIINNGSINVFCEEIRYSIDIFNIGYEKKLFTGLGGITADETELLIGRNNLFFKPYASRKVFDISGYVRIERISNFIENRTQSAVDSIFHVNENSTIDVKYADVGGCSAISLISSSGINTMININNVLQLSYINFFVKGDSANPINVKLESGKVNKIDKIKKNVPILNLSTEGTWSIIKSIPINTGLVSIADNATAIAPPYNYITGMSYFNTTENAISIVV